MTSSSWRIQILFKCSAHVANDDQVNREATTETLLTTPSEKWGARREFLYHNYKTPTYLKKSPYTPNITHFDKGEMDKFPEKFNLPRQQSGLGMAEKYK